MRRRSMRLISLARRLRSESTVPERTLWRRLRDSRRAGTHFRRQAPIGDFVVDFACLTAKVVIEVDGWSHHFNEESHLQRQLALEQLGFVVLRFDNASVITSPDEIANVAIQVALNRIASGS